MEAWWKTAKFWLLAAVAIGFSIIVLVFRQLFQGPKAGTGGESPGFGGLPPAPAPIQEAADSAYEASLAAKATAKAATEIQQQRLAEIAKIEDKRQRRKALSDFIGS